MNFLKRYSVIIGLAVLAVVIIVLLSGTAPVFSSGVFIDSELDKPSGEEVYVRTRMDFGSQEHMAAFPMQIGEWQGYDYDTTRDREQLGADVIVLRGYSIPKYYVPMFLLLMQARTESSFHPPDICYAWQGYSVQESGTEQILVTDKSWVESSTGITIPLSKIVVIKKSGQEITERRVALYCYVKGNQFASDTITMIRVEALAPIIGSYDGMLKLEKDFLSQSIPYMFEPAQNDQWHPLAFRLIDLGIGGYFVIALMLFLPLAIIVYPRTRWAR